VDSKRRYQPSHSRALQDRLELRYIPVSTTDEVTLTNTNEWKSNMCKPVKWTKCDYSPYIKLSNARKVKLYPTEEPNANRVSIFAIRYVPCLRLKAHSAECVWSAFRTLFYIKRDNSDLISILLQITYFALIRLLTPWQQISKAQHCSEPCQPQDTTMSRFHYLQASQIIFLKST
jgi:hypothetical protein